MEKVPAFGLSTYRTSILETNSGIWMIVCNEAFEDFLYALKFSYIEAPLDCFFCSIGLDIRVLRVARYLNKSFHAGQNLLEGLLIHARSVVEVPRKVSFFMGIADYACDGISRAAIGERLSFVLRI